MLKVIHYQFLQRLRSHRQLFNLHYSCQLLYPTVYQKIGLQVTSNDINLEIHSDSLTRHACFIVSTRNTCGTLCSRIQATNLGECLFWRACKGICFITAWLLLHTPFNSHQPSGDSILLVRCVLYSQRRGDEIVQVVCDI